MLGFLAALEQRIARAAMEQTLVDDPRERFDVGAAQIFLQLRRLMHGRRFGQGHEQDAREGRIA